MSRSLALITMATARAGCATTGTDNKARGLS